MKLNIYTLRVMSMATLFIGGTMLPASAETEEDKIRRESKERQTQRDVEKKKKEQEEINKPQEREKARDEAIEKEKKKK